MVKLTPFGNKMIDREDRDDFESLLDNFFKSPITQPRTRQFKLDVKEKDDSYEIEADLPGVDKDNVKISYLNDSLTIEVKKSDKKEEKDENYIHRERSFESMKRVLDLPGLDASDIKAKLDNGVLKIKAKKDKTKEEGQVIDIE